MPSRIVAVGQRVAQGQQIGTVGSVGTGVPHLHYELRYDANGDGDSTNSEIVYSTFNGVEYNMGSDGQRSYNVTSRNCGGKDLGVLDFHLSDDVTSGTATRSVIHYGQSPMVPIVGDWDGDGKDTVSTFHPESATFFISNNPSSGQADKIVPYGNPNQAVPVVGDWDGDGKDNIGVRMGGTFYLRTSAVEDPTEATRTVAFGDVGDIPLAGDWDGDGKDNVGVHRPGTNSFHLRMGANTSTDPATRTVAYGNPGAFPLVGDWDGNGKDNIGVRMGATFFLRTSAVDSNTETTTSILYGNGSNQEYPVVGDWDGNGKATQGIVY
jgi:hypothetical protein